MCLATVSYRLATEPEFMNHLRQDLPGTLSKAGIHPDTDELVAIREYLNHADPAPISAGDPDDQVADPWYPIQNPLPD